MQEVTSWSLQAWRLEIRIPDFSGLSLLGSGKLGFKCTFDVYCYFKWYYYYFLFACAVLPWETLFSNLHSLLETLQVFWVLCMESLFFEKLHNRTLKFCTGCEKVSSMMYSYKQKTSETVSFPGQQKDANLSQKWIKVENVVPLVENCLGRFSMILFLFDSSIRTTCLMPLFLDLPVAVEGVSSTRVLVGRGRKDFTRVLIGDSRPKPPEDFTVWPTPTVQQSHFPDATPWCHSTFGISYIEVYHVTQLYHFK